MNLLIKKIISSESGQGTMEYTFMMLLYITLALIGFIVVPYFAEGFDVLLDRILENSYDPDA